MSIEMLSHTHTHTYTGRVVSNLGHTFIIVVDPLLWQSRPLLLHRELNYSQTKRCGGCVVAVASNIRKRSFHVIQFGFGFKTAFCDAAATQSISICAKAA